MRKAEAGRGPLAATVVMALSAAACLLPAGRASAAPAAGTKPAAMVRELITVTAVSYTSTYATFRAYDVSGKKKTLVFGPWTARVGYNGIAPYGYAAVIAYNKAGP
jgi:hypothetical protein